MKREAVIRILRQRRGELAEKYGVKSLALFGSFARNEVRPDSDVDLLVEFDRPVGYFGLFALQDYLEALLGCPVDLGTPNSLKPRIKEQILREAIHVT
jgi:predicted nucleotidyltransferase